MLRHAEFHSVIRHASAATEEPMRITMLTDRRAAIDDAGVVVDVLHAGETYELPADLAGSYLERGYARLAAADSDGGEKDAGGSPETKNAQPRARRPRSRAKGGRG